MRRDFDPSAVSRRGFLRQSCCAAVGVTGLANTLTQLRLVNAAVAAESNALPENDYKALVCVFLAGGNDGNNTIIPYGLTEHAGYAADRGVLAIPRDDLEETALSPATYNDGRQFALHPRLTSVKDLFDNGKLAVLCNAGTLVAPTTRAQYLAGAAEVPPQLFSHSDQQQQWQSSVPDKPFQTGWGGRLAGELISAHAELNTDVSMSMSIAGANAFMIGPAGAPLQYHLTSSGSISFSGYGSNYSSALDDNGAYRDTSQGKRLEAFHNLLAQAGGNFFEEGYADVVSRAFANDLLIKNAVQGIPELPPFPPSRIAGQLNMVAQLIAARGNLGQKRQIFFCRVGGYDTHATQKEAHDALMLELNDALAAFWAALESLTITDRVTTFTVSDFGRTYTPNGSTDAAGADHAWGGHHFIMGDAVNGGDMYGNMPVLEIDGPDDTNGDRGRWIPTTSVDQYGATLARWFGVTGERLAAVFPNLHRFDHPDLGFMNPA